MIKKINYLKDYFKYLDNPISALLFKFGIKKNYNAKFKSIPNINIEIFNIPLMNIIIRYAPRIMEERIPEFLELINQINNNEKIISINDINYLNLWNTDVLKKYPFVYSQVCLFEYYNDDEWDMVNFEGREVIDIGSNVGDTSLYFAKMGANVIGFEPVKELHEVALKNLQLNPQYSNKIKLVNKGVGGKRGKLNINDSSAQDYANNVNGYEIEIITIEDILNDYKFKPDILKMDCEGCEFEIILNNDLSMFNDIIFEYHSYITGIDYKKLVNKLKEQNFNVDVYDVNSSSGSLDEIGFIHAYK